MDGTILKISRFCTDDGPGIRTTVFLKGCPLSCIWCHNPESQRKDPEIWYIEEKCVGCRKCADVCENNCHTFNEGSHKIDFGKCKACMKCADICPADALEVIGKKVSVDKIVAEVEKDIVFYKNSGGGVTVSGGEPLLQSDFTAEILRSCKEKGIHTAIETSGAANKEALEKVMKYCDLVLFDIKETNAEAHKDYTGANFSLVINSLKTINEMGIPFIVRMPVIPGLNDRKDHFDAVKNIVCDMPHCKAIEIMPYHSLGAYKYKQLGKKYRCEDIAEPAKSTVDEWRQCVRI